MTFALGFLCGVAVTAAILFGWAAWGASRDDDDFYP